MDTLSFSDFDVFESFGVVCRLCLRNHEELVDLFEAGMCDKILEITSLKVL